MIIQNSILISTRPVNAIIKLYEGDGPSHIEGVVAYANIHQMSLWHRLKAACHVFWIVLRASHQENSGG